ncbi:hypothetical protein Agub_g9575 [Astrephomene gubernaculifera]|uniref:Uncharacterized protein n=1 Tax=Astrephomene gubernaculifera TaxID=47775 RepID=A0AAD3DTP3_9CHLO|nr:hypothetical protein Agub_g9575 [Astrephomene gubernaculifera]
MSRRLSTVAPVVLGATPFCATWLTRALGISACSVDAAAFALHDVRRGLAAAPGASGPTASPSAGQPRPWEPPSHSPKSLNAKPQPTLQELLSSIRQAATPLELHNVYRRTPAHLPPHIAAAKFTRLAQLLRNSAASQSQPQQPQPQPSGAESQPQPQSSLPPGAYRLLREIRVSWDALLHLFPAEHLAACVRASCESGLLQGQGQGGQPAAGGERGLVERSLEVLLDAEGRELQQAGPQAVLDVSYGLMLAGHTQPATWRTLGQLLRQVQGQLPAEGTEGGEKAPRELAGEVLKWVGQKGLMK